MMGLAIYLIFIYAKNMMENNNLFVYSNPEKDDSIGDIPGLNMLCKESTSKLVLILILF